MPNSRRKFLLNTAVCAFVLIVLLSVVVYQEFGPIDHSNLEVLHIRETNLVADFMHPKGNKGLPLIVALGGSGGGFLPEKELQCLALRGYAVLSVAYFNVKGLPDKLENIPLEYFINAIAWATKQPVVDSEKVIVLGVSRGAELALLLASFYPEIKGVIAYAPGCFVLPNAVDTKDTIATQSSWTREGKPLAFAPLKVLDDDNGSVIRYRTYIEPLLANNSTEAYTIKLEHANGPILFLSGGADATWPSTAMADLLEHRLGEKKYPYEVRNINFPEAGHWLVQFQNNYQLITSTFFRIVGLNFRGKRYRFEHGGSAWATMAARRKAREETLRFLEQFK